MHWKGNIWVWMNSLVCRKVKTTFIIKGNASSFMGVARTA